MDTVAIDISDEPITGAKGETIGELVYRAPTFKDYRECGGDPFTVQYTADRSPVFVEHDEVIWAYARRCLVQPADPLLLEGASFRIAQRVKARIMDFFLPGVAGRKDTGQDQRTSPTPSSSSAMPATSRQRQPPSIV